MSDNDIREKIEDMLLPWDKDCFGMPGTHCSSCMSDSDYDDENGTTSFSGHCCNHTKFRDDVTDALMSLFTEEMVRAREETTKEIHGLFDLSRFDPTGTMMDPHMMSRTPEEIKESRQYNIDHSWAAMSAQHTIDGYLASLKEEVTDNNVGNPKEPKENK